MRKIVVFRTDRIGEVVLATPMIEALKRAFPMAGISFVTSPYSRDIVEGRADLDEIIIFDTIRSKVPLWEALPLSRKLRKRGFDVAIVLNPHKVLHLACYLAGIPLRVGFNRKWGFLFNRTEPDTRNEGKMHEIRYNLDLLKTLGVLAEQRPPFINVSSRDEYYTNGILRQCGIREDDRIVVVHPGSSNPAKRWPRDNFAQVVKKLAGHNNTRVIIIGDNDERSLCDELASEGGKYVLNLAGLFSLKQLAALFKRADVLITNDNGPMHIAAAVDTKVVAIFGRNIPGVGPIRWGPYGSGHTVFHRDPECSPCYDRDCTYGFKCLTNITPDEVFNAALEYLR